MTSPVPGVDVTGLTDPLPDPAHEAVRKTVLQALGVVWADHQALVARVAALEKQMGLLIPASTATGSITLNGKA